MQTEANNVQALVGQAWGHHREGHPETALAEFQKLVRQYPNDIDVNYGLGLSQKLTGHTEEAIQSFNHTLKLIDENQNTRTAQQAGLPDEDNVRTPEDDRLNMLQRMTKQRLSELQTASKRA